MLLTNEYNFFDLNNYVKVTEQPPGFKKCHYIVVIDFRRMMNVERAAYF